ncbi:MAG: ECF transporter S component [Christensenellaceae bacterium]|nr:ECF transporter S component [Christensenellaceae bacterium]
MVLAAMFLALALVLPFLTLQMGHLGQMFLPMHLPVLLCGFICGWPWGLAVGFIAPLIRSVIFGMPPMFPTAVAMAFELAAYGFLTGLFYRLFPKRAEYIYAALLLAMIGGRIVWSLVSFVLYGIAGTAFTWEMLIGGAVLNALPGIAIQIVLIPLIMIALQLTRKKPGKATEAA